MARKSTRFIVIHCSATPPSMDIGAAEIDRWHRARGWRQIGYHYVIRRDGHIELGRERHEVGAHAKGHNHNSIGICLIGGISSLSTADAENNFTDLQWLTLQHLLSSLHDEFPGAAVIGHNEISSKECPSFDVQAWLPTVGLGGMANGRKADTCPTCGQPLPA